MITHNDEGNLFDGWGLTLTDNTLTLVTRIDERVKIIMEYLPVLDAQYQKLEQRQRDIELRVNKWAGIALTLVTILSLSQPLISKLWESSPPKAAHSQPVKLGDVSHVE